MKILLLLLVFIAFVVVTNLGIQFYRRWLLRQLRMRGDRRVRPKGFVANLDRILLTTMVGVGSIAALFFQRPIFGLVGLILVPLCSSLVKSAILQKRILTIDQSSVPFFHALYGVLKTGANLPSALLAVCEHLQTPFSDTMGAFLKEFGTGTNLESCLVQFREKTNIRFAASTMALLQLAYKSNLPVLGILERALPVIETELHTSERLRTIRRSCLFQGGFVLLFPWLLSIAMFVFEPGVVNGFVQSQLFYPIIVLCLSCEAIGTFYIWKTSNFY